MIWCFEYTSNEVCIEICTLFEEISSCQSIGYHKAIFLNKLLIIYWCFMQMV